MQRFSERKGRAYKNLVRRQGFYGGAMAVGAELAGRALRYMRTPAQPQSTQPKKKTGLPSIAVRKTRKQSLKKRLSRLEKKVSNETSLIIYKYDSKDTVRPTAGSASYSSRSALDNQLIELALGQARFFDPATPGTLITASLATPTFSQKVLFSVYSTCVIKNNYQIPCMVTFGVVLPKLDTSDPPQTTWAAGLVDQGNPDNTSTLLNWSDSTQMSEVWTVKGKWRTVVLAPGRQVTMTYFTKPFTYDPSYTDSYTSTVSKRTRSAIFAYRVQGLLGHDTSVSSEVGMAPAGVDVYVRNDMKVQYNSGGASVKTIILNENASQSFTNGAVVSQLLVDNQAYSVA